MVSRVVTVAFQGVDARRVDVEVQLTGGEAHFVVVGLGDKAVAESRERVRGAFTGLGLAMPGKRVVVNLAPADLPKEGSHYDLPIALAVMGAMGVIPLDALSEWAAVGELSLDGSIAPVAGALPAAIAAGAMGLGLICPEACGPEAAWAGETRILAPRSLIGLINHFRGTQMLSAPAPGPVVAAERAPDLREVRGQEQAKRALEIAAAGGHNLLFVGPPGSGKSMLAQRLPGLLPPLTAGELLETSMVHSVAGLIAKGTLTRDRPFRSPHHSASMAALTGGGMKAKPGEVSLAHNGVLFLDELPEFGVQALDSLRQPIETGEVMVARANHHVRYPARFQLVAAMNPCGRVALLLPGVERRLKGSRPEAAATLEDPLGKHLVARRQVLGDRQIDAAKAMRIDPKTLLGWERDERIPSIRQWPKILTYLSYEPWPKPASMSQKLIIERRRRGLSIDEAALLVGIDEETWRRCELGCMAVSARVTSLLSAFVSEDARYDLAS